MADSTHITPVETPHKINIVPIEIIYRIMLPKEPMILAIQHCPPCSKPYWAKIRIFREDFESKRHYTISECLDDFKDKLDNEVMEAIRSIQFPW